MSHKTDGKIAVFICGPVRYVTLVNERLETVLKDYDYDCFFHLWKADLGNKVRQGPESDHRELFDHPRSKVVIMQTPYSEDDFKDRIGTKTNSGSTINATMGMFFSVNVLCHYLKQLPDFDQYKYILRLRTDLAILNDDFASLLSFEPDVLTIVNTGALPVNWISDHICFGPVEQFFKLWFYEDMNGVYEAYRNGIRSPERMLAFQYSRHAKNIVLNQPIMNFLDYHVVHFPPIDKRKSWASPESIRKALNTAGVEEFFRSPHKHVDFAQIKGFCTQLCEERDTFVQIYERVRKEHEALDNKLMRTIANFFCILRQKQDPPKTIEKKCMKMISFLESTELKAAARILRFMRNSQPKGKDTIKLLGYIEARLKAQKLLEEGIDDLGCGNTTQALTCFDEALSTWRPFPELNFARAAALTQLRKPLLAIDACKMELKINPEHESAKNLLAKLETTRLEFLTCENKCKSDRSDQCQTYSEIA